MTKKTKLIIDDMIENDKNVMEGLEEAAQEWANEMEDRINGTGKFAGYSEYKSKVWNRDYYGMKLTGYDQYKLDQKIINADEILEEVYKVAAEKGFNLTQELVKFLEDKFVFMVFDSVAVDGGAKENECAIDIIISYMNRQWDNVTNQEKEED